jgi:exosome complex component RRP43
LPRPLKGIQSKDLLVARFYQSAARLTGINNHVVPAVVISPVCSSKNRKQATDYAAHLTNLIVQRVLATGNKASIVVDLNQLCIVEKEIVWVLYADITCLDDDGALEDAVMMAFQSALQSGKNIKKVL